MTDARRSAVRGIVPLAVPPDAIIDVPGSKSLTNRALMLGALADGATTLTNALFSDDTVVMVDALRQLGFDVTVDASALAMTVHGNGGEIPARDAEVFAGGAGTVMRFLTAMVALGHGRYRLDGIPRMRERPIGSLLDALARWGVSAAGTNGKPPVTVDARGITGGTTSVRGEASSQFLSALLMVAPYARVDCEIDVAGRLVGAPYVEMTIASMADFGVAVDRISSHRLGVRAGQRYRARQYDVEPDASSAAYFFAAAAITRGRVKVPGLSPASWQGDVRFVDVLESMGCTVERTAHAITVSGVEALRGVDVDMAAISDQVMTLAAIAPYASAPTRIRGAAHIRHQESDRLNATVTELRRLGQDVTEHDDGLTIVPRPVRSATIETYGDHRLAMAFAVAGLRTPGIAIADPECVAKTFPDFFERLDKLRVQRGVV
jgi:3-phosphoshikimate 1-carboxyvinyltransferase